MTNYRLMQVKSIAECSKGAFCNTFDSKGSILQYFWPSFKLPFVIKIFILSVLHRFYCINKYCEIKTEGVLFISHLVLQSSHGGRES